MHMLRLPNTHARRRGDAAVRATPGATMRRGRSVVPASPPTSRRGRRSGRLVLLGALTACALSVAGVSGATAATHPVKPSAKSFLTKGSAATSGGVKAFAEGAGEGGGD